MTQNVDIFDDLADTTTPSEESTANVVSDSDAPEATDTSTTVEDGNAQDDVEPAVETVSEVPEGAVSVTEFAALLTRHFMKEKVLANEDFDNTEYVVPTSVYQTVKAAKDKIPHVLVKVEGSDEPKVYILSAEALEWWLARRERLATRGTGISKSASQRTPEDNKVLLAAAVGKLLHAKARAALWAERTESGEKLVNKYKGFLADAKISDDDVALVVQEATDKYNAEMAEKAKVKAASSKSDEE